MAQITMTTKSRTCRTGRSHIVVTAVVEDEKEEKYLSKALKKAVRKLKKLSDGEGEITFESYISIRNSSHQEG